MPVSFPRHWKLPRKHRDSAGTIALVLLMFFSALLWVREQVPGQQAVRVVSAVPR